jgi:hypothetical protein
MTIHATEPKANPGRPAPEPEAPAEPPGTCQVCGARRRPEDPTHCRVCGEPVINWGWAP